MEFQVTFQGNKQILAHIGDHTILTDQPIQAGGNNQGPSPFSLFLASIGTCAGIYVKSFCDQRGINSEGITIIQRHSFNQMNHLIENIELEVKLPTDFPEKYKETLIKVADQCAVKKHLHTPPSIRVFTS